MKIAGPVFVCIIMLTVIFGCTKPEEPRVERPSDIPEPYYENHTLHGPEDDLVIVRSQGAEYVQLNGLVFLWQHGTNLIGVYGKNGQVATSLSSLTAITNIVVTRSNQTQQIEK
jgi:hypothetical protein